MIPCIDTTPFGPAKSLCNPMNSRIGACECGRVVHVRRRAKTLQGLLKRHRMQPRHQQAISSRLQVPLFNARSSHLAGVNQVRQRRSADGPTFNVRAASDGRDERQNGQQAREQTSTCPDPICCPKHSCCVQVLVSPAVSASVPSPSRRASSLPARASLRSRCAWSAAARVA